jgi:hypothetical protein
MFDLFKRLFASTPPASGVWEAMEKMDPLLSFQRFQALKLTKQQRPLVQGLIDGTVKPDELDAVREWTEQHGEDPAGIHAVVFALQYALEGKATSYLFEYQVPAPTARFPNFVDDDSLAVIFNDRENHLQITSLKEFVSANGIGDYGLESLSPSQLRGRMQSRGQRYQGIDPSTADQPSLYKGRRVSITIEKNANADDELREAVEAAEIASALNADGFNVALEDVCLESPLEKLGLYRVAVLLEPDTSVRVSVWVVPSVEPRPGG